jgi:cellobiose phosphorylase
MAKKMKWNDIYSYEKSGRELWCNRAQTPRRFDNMIYNDAYFAQIDQNMRGVPEVGGRHITAEGYICNVVSGERVVYVRDDVSGKYFSAGFTPTCRQYTSYRCGNGLNYQIVENTTDGLNVTWRIYIPLGKDPLEIWDVRVENLSGHNRKISLITEIPMECDGVDLFGGFLYRRATFEKSVNAIFVQQDGERHQTIDFPNHNGFITADRKAASWCTNRDQFIGFTGTLADPEALKHALIPRHVASRYTPTGSLQVSFEVGNGQSADTRFLVGACDRPAFIGKMRKKYFGGNLDADSGFDAVVSERAVMMKNIQIDVPDANINPKFNVWIKQQMHFGTVHCRWGYKGFRDIVQQAQGILTQAPGLSRAIIIKACGYQYADGFALRGWHPIDPMRYADSAQWMVSAVAEYVKETGDFKLLAQKVGFYDKGSASVYEHLLRAMRRLHTDRGAHGLCKIFFGDWNDSLTGVGRKGRGESVWLSMAFCRSAMLMEELAVRSGNQSDAILMRRWHKEMVRNLNRSAWDGNWYLCALDDDGKPIGSNSNREGKIFLNMQSWAQLGRVCGDAHWDKVWKQTLRHLDSGWGLKLNWPTYSKPVANVGRMSYMRMGICENGSVYTHGNAFMLLALVERGMADEALQLLGDIDPVNPKRPILNQPNLYFNGYLGPDALVGKGSAEHVWCTGSAVWLFLVLTEYILGLRRTYDGLVVKPCFPSRWKQASITRVYRGTTYKLEIRNPGRKANAPVKTLTVDGKPYPVHKPLPIDGKSHLIVAVLG